MTMRNSVEGLNSWNGIISTIVILNHKKNYMGCPLHHLPGTTKAGKILMNCSYLYSYKYKHLETIFPSSMCKGFL